MSSRVGGGGKASVVICGNEKSRYYKIRKKNKQHSSCTGGGARNHRIKSDKLKTERPRCGDKLNESKPLQLTNDQGRGYKGSGKKRSMIIVVSWRVKVGEKRIQKNGWGGSRPSSKEHTGRQTVNSS